MLTASPAELLDHLFLKWPLPQAVLLDFRHHNQGLLLERLAALANVDEGLPQARPAHVNELRAKALRRLNADLHRINTRYLGDMAQVEKVAAGDESLLLMLIERAVAWRDRAIRAAHNRYSQAVRDAGN